LKKYFKDISDKWDISSNASENARERRNKGYQFLKQIESLSDTSGESGNLKKRNLDKNKKSDEREAKKKLKRKQ